MTVTKPILGMFELAVTWPNTFSTVRRYKRGLKFYNICIFNRLKIQEGPKIYKSYVTLTMPLSEVFCHPYAETCYDPPFAKFEISHSTAYELKYESDAKCRKNSPDRGLRSSPQLDPDLVENHIVVNDSSISNILPSFIEIGRSRFLANFEVT